MSYNPNIPQPTDKLSKSQGQILSNFTLSNTYFGVDHSAFNASSRQGQHNRVSFIGQIPAYVPIALNGITVAAVSNISHYNLYAVENPTGGASSPPIQLTNFLCTPVAGSKGATFLPGGLMLQWGTENAPAGTSGVWIFEKQFTIGGAPISPYAVLITPIRSAGAGTMNIYVLDGSVTSVNFRTENTGSGAHDFYYMAIGLKT